MFDCHRPVFAFRFTVAFHPSQHSRPARKNLRGELLSNFPPIRVIRTRVKALQTEGVKHHPLGGTVIAITTPARTVADCFKHRKNLGIDVCVEALRETLNARKATIGEMSEMGRLLRVGKVMKPYLEAMI